MELFTTRRTWFYTGRTFHTLVAKASWWRHLMVMASPLLNKIYFKEQNQADELITMK